MARRSRLLRGLLLVAIAGAVGQLVSKRLTFGDESSDAVGLAAIVGGKELKSHATALRSASALAVVGGVELDLRDASLDPAGATLNVTAVMGGVEVKVPPGWVVEVENYGKLSGVDTPVTAPEDHPEGAPTLRVSTSAWFAGVEISN
jgi:hypothetical protein